MRSPRALAPALVLTGLISTGLLATTAGPAAAECTAQRTYTVVPGGYFDQYDSLVVPPSTGPVTKTITTTTTHSSTSTVSASASVTVDAFIAELKAEVGGSYAVTSTVATASSVSLTANPSTATQEMRYGTFMEKIQVDLGYYGCPGAPAGNTSFAYAAREGAGVVAL